MSIFIIFFVYLSLCIMKIISILKENKENGNLRNKNKILKFNYFMLTKKTNFYNSLRFCMMKIRFLQQKNIRDNLLSYKFPFGN